MNTPSKVDAEKILLEAESMNPGIEWTGHSRTAGFCAGKIAAACPHLDEDTAYVLGLLHDVGRRVGRVGIKHIMAGYYYSATKQ